jgi:hypothetical protein
LYIIHAQPGDIPDWLGLAAEVEYLFGPMVGEPGFHQALERNIERGTALCIRESNGPAGSPLLAGLLFSATHAPRYRIGWLAVAARQRRYGLGQALVGHMLAAITPPAELEVVTFLRASRRLHPAKVGQPQRGRRNLTDELALAALELQIERQGEKGR